MEFYISDATVPLYVSCGDTLLGRLLFNENVTPVHSGPKSPHDVDVFVEAAQFLQQLSNKALSSVCLSVCM